MVSGCILLVGGSSGIGLAIAQHLTASVERLICVSRRHSPFGEWIKSDLSTQSGVEYVLTACADKSLDALLYLGGTWEEGAFTREYSFEASPRDEIDRVLAVNLTAPVKLIHGLLPALRRSKNPRVLLIGSLSGLERSASREVANSASKYGLRGAAHALALEAPDVPVTVINPGNVGTAEVMADVSTGRFKSQTPIPLDDLTLAIDFTLRLSRATVASEINLLQVMS